MLLYPIHGLIIAVIRMKMGRMMRPDFAIHADDDPVEAAELRHRYAVRTAPFIALVSTPNGG
jgi:predicted alpha/beta-fold hydrolase